MAHKVGDKVIAFNAREWEEAGFDQPEGNAQFFQETEVLEVYLTVKSDFGPGGEEVAVLRWPDGRTSAGHFTENFNKGES